MVDCGNHQHAGFLSVEAMHKRRIDGRQPVNPCWVCHTINGTLDELQGHYKLPTREEQRSLRIACRVFMIGSDSLVPQAVLLCLPRELSRSTADLWIPEARLTVMTDGSHHMEKSIYGNKPCNQFLKDRQVDNAVWAAGDSIVRLHYQDTDDEWEAVITRARELAHQEKQCRLYSAAYKSNHGLTDEVRDR